MLAAGVDVRPGHEAQRVEGIASGRDRRRVHFTDDARRERALDARFVFNCTYANLNALLSRSGLPLVPLKAELAEMALVEVPPELARVGVTVMCGPFFSFMPFPPRGLHTFSHVRYTPHHAWYERDVPIDNLTYFERVEKRSHFQEMRLDTARYMPLAAGFVQKDSLWEVKAVLPASESDDSRPILFRRDGRLEGLFSVLGGKIDNVYDVERELSEALVAERPAGRLPA